MQKNIKTIYLSGIELARSFQDVRIIGVVMFLVVALMITWSGVSVIETNYRLQKDIALQQQKNTIQELKNQNLALENKYLESNEYLELEARKNLGLAAPGETVYVVPKAVAIKHTIPPEKVTTESESKNQKSNIEAWIDFLFNRRG
jgi:cell division protein FtsL